MSEPHSANCSRLAEVMGLSHDSVNRFLLREAYEPHDLFNEAKGLLNLIGGTLSVDDSPLDKPYSQHMALVSYVWVRRKRWLAPNGTRRCAVPLYEQGKQR